VDSVADHDEKNSVRFNALLSVIGLFMVNKPISFFHFIIDTAISLYNCATFN